MQQKLTCSVTLLRAEHLAEAAAIERACFSEPWSEQALALLTGEGAFGVVALCDGQTVAYGGMTCVLDEGAVTNIAVSPSHRRQGLGQAVTEALLAEARRRGISSVFLEVRESNLAARGLYEKLGFSVCGIRKNFYKKPVESALQMVWAEGRRTDGEERGI